MFKAEVSAVRAILRIRNAKVQDAIYKDLENMRPPKLFVTRTCLSGIIGFYIRQRKKSQ